jgi:membrane protease subunit (stomatin/prohibitin family)
MPSASNVQSVQTGALGYRVTKTENVNTATGVDLFTVTGKVLLTLLTGEVTNALDAAVTDYKLRIKTDNIDLCAASDISSDAVGTLYSLTGDATDTLVTAAEGIKHVDHSDSGIANRVIGLAGGSCVIQSNRTAGASGDEIVWTAFYIPLEAGASVASA